MAKTTHYEWIVETLDEDGNVEDVAHWATYAEALVWAATLQQQERDVDVGLYWRKVDDDDPFFFDEAWAYIDEGSLPVFFEDAYGVQKTKVPQRFHREVEKEKGGTP